MSWREIVVGVLVSNSKFDTVSTLEIEEFVLCFLTTLPYHDLYEPAVFDNLLMLQALFFLRTRSLLFVVLS